MLTSDVAPLLRSAPLMLATTPARACGVRFALLAASGCYYVSCVKGALVLVVRSVFVFSAVVVCFVCEKNFDKE